MEECFIYLFTVDIKLETKTMFISGVGERQTDRHTDRHTQTDIQTLDRVSFDQGKQITTREAGKMFSYYCKPNKFS